MKRREPIRDALALQRTAAREGFDWRRARDLWPKLAEEIGELRDARSAAQRREELGDLLFMLVNLARHLDVDPSAALRGANRKFTRRYAFIRRHFDQLPPRGDRRRLDAMEALWQEAKRKERGAR
ncbi:MAG TPA: MazG nucleotide pyrophosphohydrolase domain-containing protein [Nevskiaceae bacterium]|nr:MazG nucleotide pyrophosphohydrolase domain-containing protein [Nevskiaceae bacterium]